MSGAVAITFFSWLLSFRTALRNSTKFVFLWASDWLRNIGSHFKTSRSSAVQCVLQSWHRFQVTSSFSVHPTGSEEGGVISRNESSVGHPVGHLGLALNGHQPNQGMNRTFIHPFVGSVMLWSPFSSPRDIGCINAGYPIR